jgi:hypothetical protein
MAMMNMLWQDASLEDRMEVVSTYNKYYANTGKVSFEDADRNWKDSKWVTIKYTFGVEPF